MRWNHRCSCQRVLAKTLPGLANLDFFPKKCAESVFPDCPSTTFFPKYFMREERKNEKEKKSSFASRYVFIAVTRDHLSISARAIIFRPHALFAFFIHSIHCCITRQNIKEFPFSLSNKCLGSVKWLALSLRDHYYQVCNFFPLRPLAFSRHSERYSAFVMSTRLGMTVRSTVNFHTVTRVREGR